jgi:hypothetical protein
MWLLICELTTRSEDDINNYCQMSQSEGKLFFVYPPVTGKSPRLPSSTPYHTVRIALTMMDHDAKKKHKGRVRLNYARRDRVQKKNCILLALVLIGKTSLATTKDAVGYLEARNAFTMSFQGS